MLFRMMRWIGLFATSVALLAGCSEVDQAIKDLAQQKAPPARINAEKSSGTSEPAAQDAQTNAADAAPRTASDNVIRIASFNIQVLGESKMQDRQVAEILAQVIRRFDIVAIQEIRAKSADFVPSFLQRINADGSQYDVVAGPRLGRTNSKEQYAFLFDTQRIEVARKSIYTFDDPHDLLHREPLIARFRVKGLEPQEAFTFSLVNIHTDPDETDTELDALATVFRHAQTDGLNEDDIILLGDLNVDERKLGELGRLPGIQWAIAGLKTNTRKTKSYDNLIFDRRTTTEFTGRSGVMDLQSEFGLSLEAALKVSDHLPVWAEFHARESVNRLATGTAEPAAR